MMKLLNKLLCLAGLLVCGLSVHAQALGNFPSSGWIGTNILRQTNAAGVRTALSVPDSNSVSVLIAASLTNSAVSNVIHIAAGTGVTVNTNSQTLNTISATSQTNAILAQLALTGAITNVVAGSNATVQILNGVATVNSTASGANAGTFNSDQFSATGGQTNIKSGVLLTNASTLNATNTYSDGLGSVLQSYYSGGVGGPALAFVGEANATNFIINWGDGNGVSSPVFVGGTFTGDAYYLTNANATTLFGLGTIPIARLPNPNGPFTNIVVKGTNTFPTGSDIAFSRYSLTTLANGENAAVPVGTNVFVQVSGPTTTFKINGISGAPNRDGKLLVLLNQSGHDMAIVHQSGIDATPGNRIVTPNGTNYTTTGNGAAILIYSGAASRWMLISSTVSSGLTFQDVTNVFTAISVNPTNGITSEQATNVAAYQSLLATNYYAEAVTNIADVISANVTKTLTNVFRVEDYGAVGDNVTINDAAFTNCLAAAAAYGGIMDWSGLGKTYVLSNFVFAASGNYAAHGLVLNGYGSKLRHVGTNWLMKWVSSSPDLKGIDITGNSGSQGAILVTGARSNVRYEDVFIHGYTTGYGFLSEGTTFWSMENCVADTDRIGFAFAAYADAMTLKLRADRCVVGVEFNATNSTVPWTYGGSSPTPVGGNWDITGTSDGDLIIAVGKEIALRVVAESCTNSFISIGHNPGRHPWQTEGSPNNVSSGPMNISFHCGFGDLYNTNYPVEMNCGTGTGLLEIHSYLYGKANSLGFVKSYVAAADHPVLKLRCLSTGTTYPSVFEFSDGSKLVGNYTGGGVYEQSYNLPRRELVDSTTVGVAGLPAFAFGTIYGQAPETQIGWWGTKEMTNFVAGLRFYRPSATESLDITNMPVNIWKTLTVETNLAVVYGRATFGPGGGSPSSGGTYVDITGGISDNPNLTLRNTSAESVYQVLGTDTYLGTRNSGGYFRLLTDNVQRWIIYSSSGALVPYANVTPDIGTTTIRVRSLYVSNIYASNITSTNLILSTNFVGLIQSGSVTNAAGSRVAYFNDVTQTTNSVAAIGTIDFAKKYAATNVSANFTITGVTNTAETTWFTAGTNVQWATRFYTNTSGATVTITLPASWIGTATQYLTNQGVLSVTVYPGFGTNFMYRCLK